jgi:hypothetical protein
MSRTLLVALTLSITAVCAVGQDLSVHDIQFTTDPSGNSPYNGQTVWTRGIVTAVNYQGQPIRYFIADRAGGLWSGILVNDNQSRFVAVGDSVHLQAEVQESSSQTRLRNIVTGTFSTVPASGDVPPVVVSSGSVGEATEGVLIELRSLTVTAVTTTSFTVNDGSGPVAVGRGTNAGWPYAYEPLVGDELSFIRGLVSSAGSTYTLNPRGDADFGFVGNRPPLISNVQNTPTSPTELQADTVTAVIIDETGVAWASVFFRFGTDTVFQSRPMYNDGRHGDRGAGDSLWGGVIPAGPVRDTCFYYVLAADSQNEQGTSPADAPTSTYSYYIRSSVLNIRDLQYTGNPTGGASPYNGQTVTVTGVVTGTEFSSYRDGFFICDPGDTVGLWSGIQVFNPQSTPALADCVLLTGQITEYSDLTEFASGASYTLLGTGHIPTPLPMRFSQLADSGEPFEGTLARLDAPMVVTDVSDWGQYRQFSLRCGSVTAAAVGDFAIEYVPAVGDSFRWMVGCVTYNSNVGWMIAPRADADMGYLDRRPPELVSAQAVSDTAVNIVFNERLHTVGIADVNNYLIVDQVSFDTLHVLNAYLFSTGKTLQLTTLERLSSRYRLDIRAVSDTSGNVLQNASVNFGAYEPGEYTPIADIYGDTTLNNVTVTLRGVVNFVEDVTTSSGSRRIAAYIQDESGRGINLSQTGAASTFPGIQRRNLIVITGVVSPYQGSLQVGGFTAASMTVLAENQPLPAPIVVRTGDLRLQRNIIHTAWPGTFGSGTWVQTAGTIYRVDENIGGGTNIAIDDGTGNLTIRVWDSMNLRTVNLGGQTYRLRDLVSVYCVVAGPSGMYNNDFQMLAGYAEDFTLPPTGVPSGELALRVPNRPFAPDLGQRLHIEYSAPALSEVRLRVFDLRGRVVATLVDKPAGGSNIIEWDGRDDLRELLPIGTYLLHLEAINQGNSRTRVKPVVIGTKL